jgi:hypothetical protein
VEILLERGALTALSNVIREEYSTEAIVYGLKALYDVLIESKETPENNMVWMYSESRIKRECKQMGLTRFIEGLLVSKKDAVVHWAGKCIDHLVE